MEKKSASKNMFASLVFITILVLIVAVSAAAQIPAKFNSDTGSDFRLDSTSLNNSVPKFSTLGIVMILAIAGIFVAVRRRD